MAEFKYYTRRYSTFLFRKLVFHEENLFENSIENFWWNSKFISAGVPLQTMGHRGLERSERRGVGQGEEAGVSVLAKSLTARLRLRASKLCDPTLEKSHLHESQVTINCQNGQLKEYASRVWVGAGVGVWSSLGDTKYTVRG